MKAPESPYLTASEAALYLRYELPDGTPNLNAFYVARHRHQIRARRRGGRTLLFKRADLEAFLEEEHREREAFARRTPLALVGHRQKVVGGR
jgi:hypothetical protein